MITKFDEKGKIFTVIVNKEPVHVIIQTTLNRIEGKIYVRPDERIKDEMDHPEPFLAVTNVHIFSLEGQLIAEGPFIAVNRNQVIWVLPVEESVI